MIEFGPFMEFGTIVGVGPGVPHTHTEIVEGCFRCELHLDEVASILEENQQDAEAAWKKYRDSWDGNRRQLRKRDFIAGFIEGEGVMTLTVTEHDDGYILIEAKPEFAPLMTLKVTQTTHHANQAPKGRWGYGNWGRSRYGWWVINPKFDWDYGCFTTKEKALKKALALANRFIKDYSVDRHVKKETA